jgi:hypothetical protein
VFYLLLEKHEEMHFIPSHDMAAAIAFARLLRSFLYEVPAFDSLTFAFVPMLLLIATLGACLIPSGCAKYTKEMV